MDITVRVDFPKAVDEWSDFYQLKHDYELQLWNYKPRSLYDPDDGLVDGRGYPEMVPFVNRLSKTWNDAMVRYMFDLCLLSGYGITYKSPEWYRLTNEQRRKLASEFETAFDSKRFLTNDTGLDISYNPIGEEVLGQPHRSSLARQWEVACGGNVVKAKSHAPVRKIATDVDGVKRPVDCIEVEVWDGVIPSGGALSMNWTTHPWLIHMATIARRT